jgi:hypothetical protein
VSRWLFVLTIGSTVLVAIVLGVVWYTIGGWPRDHDRYGTLPIPGRATLELPKGEVRLSFEGNVSGGQTSILEDAPAGLRVQVSRRGRELEVESVPSFLYSVASGDRGHEPYGKVDVPEAGRWRVETSAQATSASGRITAGPELWNPLGSRAVGAVAIAVAAFLVLFLLFELPLLVALGRRSG